MKKRAFSLLELLLVLVLIALGLGTMTFSFKKAFSHETFESSVDRVLSKLEMAEKIMLYYDTDVTFTIKEHPKGIEILLGVSEVMSENFLSSINKQRIISGIQSVEWNDQPLEGRPLFFIAIDAQTPKGALTLRGKEKAIKIGLKGHVGKIEKKGKTREDKAASYPQEALSFT